METFEHLTKIVATIGPSSSDEETLIKLVNAGLDVCRINFSHGDREDHVKMIRKIRNIAPNIAILQDLCGPKIRVGELKGGEVKLVNGEECTITTEDIKGTKVLIPTSFKTIDKEAAEGDRILLDDGKLELKIISKAKGKVKCKVIQGGILKDKKGMNFPDSDLTSSCITEKDIEDLKIGLATGIDFVALSFVKDEKDIIFLKELIEKFDKVNTPHVLAKIERPQAIDNLEAILDNADGIMVARGDLGVELDIAKVALLQKKIINCADTRLKHVITATQMLESMTVEKIPTRAEVSDVANAILDGSGAVMLSAETATGKFPVESVLMLDRIGAETEDFMRSRHSPWKRRKVKAEEKNIDAIGHAAYNIFQDLNVKAIVSFSKTGGTALYLSKHRPLAPIIVFTDSIHVCRRMQLTWGVYPILSSNIKSNEDLKREFYKINMLEKGDKFVIIASSENFGQEGSSNIIEIGEY